MSDLKKIVSIYSIILKKAEIKYAEAEHQDEWQTAIEKLQHKFPEISGDLPKFETVKSFFENVIPYVVYQHIVDCLSLRQCISASWTLAVIANMNNIPSFIGGSAGHFLVIALSDTGPILMDPTAAQFHFPKWCKSEDLDPEDEDSIYKYIVDYISPNPFAAAIFYKTNKSINTVGLQVPDRDQIGYLPKNIDTIRRRIQKSQNKRGWGDATDTQVSNRHHPSGRINDLYPPN